MDFKRVQEAMVSCQISQRGITDARILEAFRRVPRHLFVPLGQRKFAYDDHPLPIGNGQTISQPYIVALMTQSLDIQGHQKVLEIGTGSGYQAAILSALGAKVYSVERIGSLASKAQELLDSLGYKVRVKVDDGTLGWKEHAPYDRIIVTAASSSLPAPLIAQLRDKGILVIPLGGRFSQDLTVVYKVSGDKTTEEKVCGCIFVPLIGKYGYSL